MNRPLKLTKLLSIFLSRMEYVLTGLIFMKMFAWYFFKNLMLSRRKEKIRWQILITAV